MRNWMIVSGMTLCLGLGASAFAGDGDDCKSKAKEAGASAGCCAKGKSASLASCGDKKGCKDVAGMPKLTYKVGDKSLCCSKEAADVAKADSKPIKYVVADKQYDGEGEAMQAYAAALENFLGKVTTVQYVVGEECVQCPMSAQALAEKSGKKVQYRLASFTFEDVDKANKTAEAARGAAGKVTMKAFADGKEVEVPKSACNKPCGDASKSSGSCTGKADTAKSGDACTGKGDTAKADAPKTGTTAVKTDASAGKSDACAGKAMEFVVGDQKYTCPLQANVELQKARIAAAVMVMEKAVAGA